MPLDPDLDRMLTVLGDAPYVDLAALPLDEAMRIARPPLPALGGLASGLHARDMVLPVAGGEIRLRCYTPETKRPHPIVVHLHGGGWVTGSIEQEDPRCQLMALEADAVVVSVGYRLSPEVRFPVPVDDCIAAWDWAEAHAAEIGGDPERMAVSGSSAGGQLAVAVLLSLKARGRRMARAQLLTYPALDPSLASASYREFADGPFMTRARMAWYWDQFLGPDGDRADPRASPRQADLSGLPQALVQVAECDVLRDEGIAYAERLRDLGIDAKVRVHPGMIHGFIAITPDHPESTIALKEGAAALKAYLE